MEAKQMITPAGVRAHSNWPELGDAIDGLMFFLLGAGGAPEAHIVFRHGTVVRVGAADPEWGGYADGAYAFPEHRITAESADLTRRTIEKIKRDSRKVWAAQSSAPEPVRGLIRRGFAALLAPGYPYPGTPASDRAARDAGVRAPAGAMHFVSWPNHDTGARASRTYNVVFAAGPAEAAQAGGDSRRYDYMFPEVAAVITPGLERWDCRPGGFVRFRDAGLPP